LHFSICEHSAEITASTLKLTKNTVVIVAAAKVVSTYHNKQSRTTIHSICEKPVDCFVEKGFRGSKNKAFQQIATKLSIFNKLLKNQWVKH
jgi:hypothetical protein